MMNWFEAQGLIGRVIREGLYGFIAVLVAYLLLKCSIRFINSRLEQSNKRAPTYARLLIIDMLKATQPLVLALTALLIGLVFIDLSDKWDARLGHIWFFILGIQIALWLNRGVTFWAKNQLKQDAEKPHEPYNPVIIVLISWILRTLVWSLLLLVVLSNVGINISAFIASLGIGGIAVALAVQNILSDIFASLVIGLDKPFEIGDFIVFQQTAGTVEYVGLKTTRLRSRTGEEVVCSNTELLKNRIHNYKRMEERPVVFTFQVPCNTSPEQLREIPNIVKEAVEANEHSRFERAHFKEFGASALIFEVAYTINDPSYNLYMDIQQSINLGILSAFREKEINLAFTPDFANTYVISAQSS